MVGYDGRVKILDFGVVKSLGQVSKTQAGQLKGKLAYASPEQLRERPLDRRADVFALGVVLWESLCVGRLFSNKDPAVAIRRILEGKVRAPSFFRPLIPIVLDEICLKALAVDPAQRYQSAEELQDALNSVLKSAEDYAGRKSLAAYMQELFAERIDIDAETLRQVAEAEEADGIVELDALEVEELSEIESPHEASDVVVIGELQSGSRQRVVLITAATAMVVALMAVLVWKSGAPESVAPAVNAEVPAMVAEADDRIAAGTLSGPNSALDVLLAAKKLDPDNTEVLGRLGALADKFEQLADIAAQAGNLSEAATHLQAALNADPKRTKAAEKMREIEELVRSRPLPIKKGTD